LQILFATASFYFMGVYIDWYDKLLFILLKWIPSVR